MWPDDCIIIIIIQSLAIYNNDNLAGYKKDKVSTKVWQILNKPTTKIAQRHEIFCQSGEFSPNLVTLPGCTLGTVGKG